MKKEEAFKNLKIENSLMSSDKKICVVDFTTLPPSCLHFSAYFDMSFQATGISTFFVRIFFQGFAKKNYVCRFQLLMFKIIKFKGD